MFPSSSALDCCKSPETASAFDSFPGILTFRYYSACVSAAFRLATTVAYGEAADAIYALGPLVFWATAEMTCGFFVCCSKSPTELCTCTFSVVFKTFVWYSRRRRLPWHAIMASLLHSSNVC